MSGKHYGIDAMTGQRWTVPAYRKRVEAELSRIYARGSAGSELICALPALPRRAMAPDFKGLPAFISTRAIETAALKGQRLSTEVIMDLPYELGEPESCSAIAEEDFALVLTKKRAHDGQRSAIVMKLDLIDTPIGTRMAAIVEAIAPEGDALARLVAKGTVPTERELAEMQLVSQAIAQRDRATPARAGPGTVAGCRKAA